MENGSYLSSSEASSVSSVATNDDVEVKKLKDLVKKLEKQNEHLRHKTGRLSSSANKLPRPKTDSTKAGGDAHSKYTYSQGGDENGLLNYHDGIPILEEHDEIIMSASIGDECSWLYQSPKSKMSEPFLKKLVSPQEWLKEEFEHPSTPQLASAKRNIMYKLDGSFDRGSPDMGYLRRSVEKRLIFPTDDYKVEDATDVKVIARLQQEELRKDVMSRTASNNVHETRTEHDTRTHNSEIYENPSSPSHYNRRGSYEDDHEINSSSSGSPHHAAHHLPIPSQTMTTAHGLYPSHVDDEESSPARRRSSTPTRSHKTPDRIGSSPRAKSPARRSGGKGLVRRSLPNPSRSQANSTSNSSLVSNSLPTTSPSLNEKQQTSYNSHQPVIKSSLVAPSSRLSRLQQRSGLPSPAASTGGRSVAAPRSSSPMMTQQRRALPRPSQTSTSMKYTSKSIPVHARTAISQPSPPPGDIWDDDDEVY